MVVPHYRFQQRIGDLLSDRGIDWIISNGQLYALDVWPTGNGHTDSAWRALPWEMSAIRDYLRY